MKRPKNKVRLLTKVNKWKLSHDPRFFPFVFYFDEISKMGLPRPKIMVFEPVSDKVAKCFLLFNFEISSKKEKKELRIIFNSIHKHGLMHTLHIYVDCRVHI